MFMENVEIQCIGVEGDLRKYLRLMEAIIGGDVERIEKLIAVFR